MPQTVYWNRNYSILFLLSKFHLWSKINCSGKRTVTTVGRDIYHSFSLNIASITGGSMSFFVWILHYILLFLLNWPWISKNQLIRYILWENGDFLDPFKCQNSWAEDTACFTWIWPWYISRSFFWQFPIYFIGRKKMA